MSKNSRGGPLVYYIGLFADQCVAIYCFCSGYALYLINEKIDSAKQYYKSRIKSTLSFLINYWIVVIVISIGIYLVAYVQRIYFVISTGIGILDWTLTQLALLGTSFLPYIIAMFFQI